MADPKGVSAAEHLRYLAFNASSLRDRQEARKRYKAATGRLPKREEGDKH